MTLSHSPGTAVMISHNGVRFTQSAQCFAALSAPAGSRMEHFAAGLDLAQAREWIAADSTGEWLFFVDDDMLFAPDLLRRLLARLDEHPDLDIIAAFAVRRWPPHFSVAGQLQPDGKAQIVNFTDTQGIARVDLTGLGGGSVIRRSAFTRLARPWFTGGPFTEDWTFCSRLKTVDGHAAVDLEAVVGHITPMAVWPTCDAGAWDVSYVPLRDGRNLVTESLVKGIIGRPSEVCV